MKRFFGTDGIRGVANTELTNELAYKVAKFGAYVITKNKKNPKIIIGKDTRISGDMLESAIISGILSVGCDVIKVGVLPTPAVSYLTKKLNADCGIMISASHNPVEFNGIKFFNHEGFKLTDETEKEIESYILGNKKIENTFVGENIGKVKKLENGNNLYSTYIKSTINNKFDNLKIAVDCSNGASFKVAPDTLKSLGADIEVINDKPNGLNINKNCGSTHPEKVKQLVKKINADIGLAFDGDADRLIAVDELGNIIDGDKIMAICGKHLKERNKLNENTIVSTVMSNIGFYKSLEKNNLKTVKTPVGDKYVLHEMRENNYNLGGEQSGHIIFLDFNTTGDGLLSALQLIDALIDSNKKLSELGKIMTKYPQTLVNAKVSNKTKNNFKNDEIILEEIKKIEDHFEDRGRVLVRASGTEPLVRVMIEGKNISEINKYATNLAKTIEKRL
ncbi:MAG: phosphoglucosamine mutase [Bacillota bacterium]